MDASNAILRSNGIAIKSRRQFEFVSFSAVSANPYLLKGKKMFSRKSRCYNGGTHHKFSPRYDEKPNPHLKIKYTWGSTTSSQVRSLVYYKVYLFDICEWCGKKVKR